MRSQGSAAELERRRRLAVQRVLEGMKQTDVAAFLGVTPRTVSRWMSAYRAGGDDAIKIKPIPGRPPKLSKRQEQTVCGWLAKSPKAFGYQTDLWTTKRLAEVIEKRFGIRFNSNYTDSLNDVRAIAHLFNTRHDGGSPFLGAPSWMSRSISRSNS